MRKTINRLWKYIATIGKILWKAIPRIAVYTLAIYALFFVGTQIFEVVDKRQVADAPGTDFLNYTSFTVQNAREGEDVTFTLCRDHKDNYSITGTRTVYIVPEGKTEKEKVFIYNKDIKGVVDSGNCQPYFIKASEYHFKPGKYLITLNINFEVKYNTPKSVFTKSGIFTIYPQPSGSNDVQSQLNNLQQRLNDQQDLLDQLIGSGSVRIPTNTQNGTSNDDDASATPAPVITNTDPDKAAVPRYRQVCDPIVNLFGLKIGQQNCRQEEY